MQYKNIVKFAVSILIPLAAGYIGSIFTISSIPTWYAALNKPTFSPPNWIFGPVWTALYIMMGISLYMVWKREPDSIPLSLFGIQLSLNVLWSYLFFGLKSPLYAFIEIIMLWAAILLTILNFKNISKTAAILLIPYLLWVSFAAVLNFYILLLNP